MSDLEIDIERFEKSTASKGYSLSKYEDDFGDPIYEDSGTAEAFAMFSIGYSEGMRHK